MVLDGDVDGSYARLMALREVFPHLRPLLVEHRGQMAALEIGVQNSSGEVVLLMDDDVLAGPGLVSGHARRHVGLEEVVVLGYMPVRLETGAAATTRLYAQEYETHCARLESGDLDVLHGLWLGNVSARRNDLVRVGVLSECFPVRWHADTDLGLRLAAAGARGVFDRGLRADHLHAQSTASFLRDALERGQAMRLLQEQHPEQCGDAGTAPAAAARPGRAVRALSVLGGGGRATTVGRLLMRVGAGAERLGWTGLSEQLARLARRLIIVCALHGSERAEPRSDPARLPHVSSSTKSGT